MATRLILFLLWTSFSFQADAQIGAKIQQQNSLYDTWTSNQYGIQMTLILKQDGTGEFDGEALTFTYKDDKLTLVSGPQPVTYTYALQGNSLMLSGGDLNEPITFTRHAGEPTSTQSTITLNQNNSSGTTTGLTLNSSDEIVGLWSASTESVEFKSDGQCAYLGQLYPYQVSPGHITLTSPQGTVTFEYAIKGDQLTMSYNGNSVTYTRVAKSPSEGQQQSAGSGKVAMELVGKWCFSNLNSYNQGASSSSECVTLNADGTYEYYNENSRSVNTADMSGGTSSQSSDRGTWYLEGDRLYVNSQTIGKASYKLEKRNHPTNVNDPMIVLDGRAFVSAYNKPPWR